MRDPEKNREEPGALLLTPAEIRMLPRGSVVWIEYFNGEKGCSDGIVCALKCGDGSLVDEETLVYDDFEEDMAPDPDGDRWRFWNAEPTDAERYGTAWWQP